MFKFSLDAAVSILALEANKIVHRDIAARNFLCKTKTNKNELKKIKQAQNQYE